jgi:hypothetical protein
MLEMLIPWYLGVSCVVCRLLCAVCPATCAYSSRGEGGQGKIFRARPLASVTPCSLEQTMTYARARLVLVCCGCGPRRVAA